MKISCQLPDHKEAIREGYDRWAEVYDHDANPLAALEAAVIHGHLDSVAALEILDLGCGTGRHALWLAEAGARVTALDFSSGMLAAAREKPGAERIQFLQHDLRKPLPFKKAHFDLVLSSLVLEHIEDLAGFYREIARVLKARGRVLLSAMHPAMFLKGSQARFTDPATGEKVQPGSWPHQISNFIMAGLTAGLRLRHLSEHAPTESFAADFPRSEKYIGWPMLLVMEFQREPGS